MDTKPTLVACWFASSLITLIFYLTLLVFLSTEKVIEPQSTNFKLYAALPQSNSHIAQDISFQDARSKIVEDFFAGYGSLLSEFNDLFIQVADKNKLDWRLLPAIAMQESNGGKKVISNSHNPFGYGIHGNLVIRFKSWEEAIERVGKALREDYLDHGLKTPWQIMTKYTPPSLAKGGTWARGVSFFMEELR